MKRIAFVVGDYPSEERTRREKVALSYSTPEVQVGIVSTPVTPYIHGLTPAEMSLVAPALIDAFRDAERQGYDAVVPLGFLDLGVEGGRSVVDIPVIAPFQAAGPVMACFMIRPMAIPLECLTRQKSQLNRCCSSPRQASATPPTAHRARGCGCVGRTPPRWRSG